MDAAAHEQADACTAAAARTRDTGAQPTEPSHGAHFNESLDEPRALWRIALRVDRLLLHLGALLVHVVPVVVRVMAVPVSVLVLGGRRCSSVRPLVVQILCGGGHQPRLPDLHKKLPTKISAVCKQKCLH